ncbi:hypothetical protein DFJ58DRAFT_644036, partial [Suillus subalutaceus]|uniref:uncharacterized protein n=1 Tax=Suillus subalutaceus TaxID=48586 RepID=UPI001B85EC48
RLLRILISESAYLIWVLRCECVIQGVTQTDKQIMRRWTKTIDNRLQLDRMLASKTKRNTKFTNLIQSTWEKIISQENHLPHNWATSLKVLVGIK